MRAHDLSSHQWSQWTERQESVLFEALSREEMLQEIGKQEPFVLLWMSEEDLWSGWSVLWTERRG